MSKAISVLTMDDAEVVELEGGTLTSRRLVRRVHGSERMSFNVSTLREGYDDPSVSYEGHDEIVYVMAGEAEFGFDGQKRTLKPGMAAFIPAGCRYSYRVTKGPNEVVAVFSPARS
jgi:quercetin dioxygenase-like cupin family protein